VSSPAESYNEKLLHWIWKTRHFEHQNLRSCSGKKVEIHLPGKLNKSDGPDFSSAQITIGKLRWYGDVEIHWKISDWKAHKHHIDANYNNVILHVVFEKTESTVLRKDQTSIPTLCLSSYVPEPLQSFVEQYRSRPKLPCAGQFTFISEDAFKQQIEKAHREYFEQKVDDLLEFYDPDLPPSSAWKKMLAIALFDGLGISHNREPMRRLAAELYEWLDDFSSRETLRIEALKLSGINSKDRSPLHLAWKHKGVRPGNHPRPRIQQAANCLWHIHNAPFEEWLREEPKELWQNLVNSITVTPSLGRERASILFGTVFLPALYSLGNLFHSEKLKSRTWKLWRTHRVPLPKSLLKLLENTNLPPSLYNQKLGTIFQLRSYCRPKHCQDCKVFKSAISP
jgi:hypothetical protein